MLSSLKKSNRLCNTHGPALALAASYQHAIDVLCANWMSCCVQVKGLMLADNPLIGSMMWMVAHEGYLDGGRDLYTLYPSAPELNALCAMNREVNK